MFSVAGMSFVVRFFYSLLAAFFLIGLTGCLPSGSSQLEEEKEPHFLAGKSKVNEMDYKGAIESFEKALEANPRSASAHFELGCLYDEKDSDPAAAIYHYQKYLKLRANSDKAELIKQRIHRCEQDLAKSVMLVPIPGMQRDLDQLVEENRRLSGEVEKWKAYYANRPPLATNLPTRAQIATNILRNPVVAQAATSNLTAANPSRPGRSSSLPVTNRSYVVKAGDSFYSISKRYGIKLNALSAANPGVDSRHLRVGQMLNLPGG